jgi:hypothetical protein
MIWGGVWRNAKKWENEKMKKMNIIKGGTLAMGTKTCKNEKMEKMTIIKGGTLAIYILLFSSIISRLTHLIMLSKRFHIIFRLWPLWFGFWNRYHKWSRDRFASPSFETIMLSKSTFFQIQKKTIRPLCSYFSSNIFLF